MIWRCFWSDLAFMFFAAAAIILVFGEVSFPVSAGVLVFLGTLSVWCLLVDLDLDKRGS